MGLVTGWTRRAAFDVAGTGQLALPGMGPALRDIPTFAHPFERHFASMLDAYDIRWRYEPTTFLLACRPDGTPAECFTPDFYLPDARTYVELTSMRQSLVTRKHRKVRRFRAACPGSRVVLLYRRDYHRMLAAWSDSRDAPAEGTRSAMGGLGRVIVPADDVRSRIEDLAGLLADRHARRGQVPVLIGVGPGGARVAGDLVGTMRTLGATAEVESVTLGWDGGRVRVVRPLRRAGRDRPVILVSGMVSTGLSMDYLTSWLRRRRENVVDTCALLGRSASRVTIRPPGLVGFEVAADVLVGYGLDLHRQYADLPFVARLDEGPSAPRGPVLQ